MKSYRRDSMATVQGVIAGGGGAKPTVHNFEFPGEE